MSTNLAYREQPEQPFVQIPLDVLEADISAGAFRLYAYLISYARQFGACWPSQATLAVKLRVSERTIRNWLKELEQAGLIEIEQRFSERGGGQQSNLYRLKRTVASREKPAPARGGKRLPPAQVAQFRPARKEVSSEIHESEIQTEKDSAIEVENNENNENNEGWQSVEDATGRKLVSSLFEIKETRFSVIGYTLEGDTLTVKGIGRPPDNEKWLEVLKRRLGVERVTVAK